MNSVGEDFPKQQARVREVLEMYRSVPMGELAARFIEEDLKEAEEAQASGDIVRILASYKTLKGIEA